MKKLLLATSLFLISNLSHAAVNGLSIHSRANCVNNESISWDWTKPHHFQTKSHHWINANKKEHIINTKSEVTRRSAAVHYGESTSGWTVDGVHKLIDDNPGKTKTYYTRAYGCNIYDGWWNW